MMKIAREIPDVNVLLALTPEELAAKFLFTMRTQEGNSQRQFMAGQGQMFHFGNMISELWNTTSAAPLYPRQKQKEVNLAFAEAWAWLEAQGLLIPSPDSNGNNGWRVLSRRAQAMESQAAFADFKVSRLLPKEILHPRIADRVWGAFVRGEFDSAVFQALKAVEVSVREAAGLGDDLVGVKLMRPAFRPEDGPLTDLQAEGGEKTARMELFAGAIGSYKNPQSHRDVNLDDPLEALEIIYLANHLLRIVDARAKARQAQQP